MGSIETQRREKISEALLIVRDVGGTPRVIDLQELHIEMVVPDGDTSARRDLIEAERQRALLTDQLNAVVEALDFYADEENYDAKPGKKSFVTSDKGQAARDALGAIGSEDDGEPA